MNADVRAVEVPRRTYIALIAATLALQLVLAVLAGLWLIRAVFVGLGALTVFGARQDLRNETRAPWAGYGWRGSGDKP